MNPLCQSEGVGIIPWSPLARGFLTGTRQRGEEYPTARARSDTVSHRLYYQETDFGIVDRVVALAERKGAQPAQIALSWLIHRPEVTAPIIGATKIVHLEEAVAALEVQLSAEDMTHLQELYLPHPVLEHS